MGVQHRGRGCLSKNKDHIYDTSHHVIFKPLTWQTCTTLYFWAF